MNHDEVTAKIGGAANYGKGIKPNPFVSQQTEWMRRKEFAAIRARLTEKIEMLFEPRFITPPETAECIESLVTMTGAKQVLELGTCTGFTSLHILRALIGKPGAKLVSVDGRPTHDKEFFSALDLRLHFHHLAGFTPDVLEQLLGYCFDLVFVESDHSEKHCEAELEALLKITRPGTIFLFHDCPSRNTPDAPAGSGVIYQWLHRQIDRNIWRGTALPSCEQLDCADAWGPGYNIECSPGLGIFVRK